MTDTPRATTTASTFRQDCSVNVTIRATPERIWALLTDAGSFPTWNSTVSSIEGRIAEGQTLRIKVPAAGDRVFTPRVSGVEASRRMTWSDGTAPLFKGVRTFELTPNADGTTEFVMREEFAGLMLPMIRRSLPDFAPVFDAYARDLKQTAERGAP